jgi:hypothetical protein
MGADSVMDRLWRLGWLLGDDAGTFAVRALAAWKADLARTTSARAFYLGDVLLRWERRHNQGHVLADDVRLDLVPGDGTRVLSPGQAGALSDALDSLPLAGNIPVRVLHAGNRLYPSVAQFISVGDFQIELPLEREARVPLFDPVPVALLMGAAWAVPTMSKRYGAAPLARVLPWVVSYLALAMGAHRYTAQHGEPARGPVLAMALAIAVGHTASVTRHLRRPTGPDGQVHFPFTDNAIGSMLVLRLYWDDLTTAWKAVALGGVAALASVGLVMSKRPLPWLRLAAEVLWLAPAVTSAGLMPAAYRDEEDRHQADQLEEDRASLQQAFAEGRSSVISLVSAARLEAWRALHRRTGLSEDDVETATSRLEVIDEMLKELNEKARSGCRR